MHWFLGFPIWSLNDSVFLGAAINLIWTRRWKVKTHYLTSWEPRKKVSFRFSHCRGHSECAGSQEGEANKALLHKLYGCNTLFCWCCPQHAFTCITGHSSLRSSHSILIRRGSGLWRGHCNTFSLYFFSDSGVDLLLFGDLSPDAWPNLGLTFWL